MRTTSWQLLALETTAEAESREIASQKEFETSASFNKTFTHELLNIMSFPLYSRNEN